MSWLHNWRSWSRAEKSLCLEAFLTTTFIRLSLWIIPFQKVFAYCERKQIESFGKKKPALSPSEISKMVSRVARRIPKASCLTQAFAARLLLAKRGWPSQLKFGARQTDGKFEAHAWIEIDGKIIIGKYPPKEFSGFKPPPSQKPSTLEESR